MPPAARLCSFLSHVCEMRVRRDITNRSEDLLVQVFAITGFQRLGFEEPEGSRPIGLSFGTQENGTLALSVEEIVGEFVKMRHVKDLDSLLQQGTDNLSCDLRSLPLV